MNKLSWFACVAALLVVAVIAAGCGDDDSDDTSQASEDKPTRGYDIDADLAQRCDFVGGSFDQGARRCTVATQEDCTKFTAQLTEAEQALRDLSCTVKRASTPSGGNTLNAIEINACTKSGGYVVYRPSPPASRGQIATCYATSAAACAPVNKDLQAARAPIYCVVDPKFPTNQADVCKSAGKFLERSGASGYYCARQ
jgi:hypothetical protein